MLSRSEDGVGEVITQAEEPSVREWAAAVRQKGHGGAWQQLGPWLTPSRALNSKRNRKDKGMMLSCLSTTCVALLL
jgi:hypothetical protein